MKILGLVTFRIFPTHMGGQKGVALFYRYLQAHFPVLLAVSTDNLFSKEVKMEKIFYPNKQIYRNIFKVRAVRKMVRENDVGLIIAEHSYAGWMAWLVSRSTKKPFIIHSHNIEGRRFQQMHQWWWRLYHGYEGWIHRKARHNFFISEADRKLAIGAFGLEPSRCSVVTYGVEERPVRKDKAALKKALGLDAHLHLFLFNGTLDYKPNYDAVTLLTSVIAPMLSERLSNYQIIITGNRAPRELARKILSAKNIVYAGYVDDVNSYYQAADLFLNPVVNDTGVKTKLIEAIANNCTAISTEAGASGIEKEVCGDKMITVAGNNWNIFVDRIIECCNGPERETPSSFYDHYNWKNIAEKAAKKITEVVLQ
jgi:glycosyltransferase involved in cell wall biosynthesis